ncbi:hypothetical protein XENOCAPTIV_012456 [Xenoophorus captivus]|uniref:Uncharacterized protein n=1 Tax=Xenoophorus captivus TaxID=1517983 RepID=A0ABV0Q5V6_9TELE
MAEQLYPSLKSPSAKESVGCTGVKYATTGLHQWRQVLVDKLCLSVWQTIYPAGFGSFKEDSTCLTVSSVKFGAEGIMLWHLYLFFLRAGLGL